MVQPLCSALVVEHFKEPTECGKVMGTMTAFQTIGAAIFSLLAGNLGAISWNLAFLVHLIAIISLIAAITCITSKKSEMITASGEKIRFQPTASMWMWCIASFVFMTAEGTYTNFASSIITELNFGNSAEAGYSLALFSLGGLITGFAYGKLAKACDKFIFTVGCIALALSFFVMVFALNLNMPYLGALICGFAFSSFMPCVLNEAGNSVIASSSAMAVSIAACLPNVGMAVCPYVFTPLGTAAATINPTLTINQWSMIIAATIVLILAVIFTVIHLRKSL